MFTATHVIPEGGLPAWTTPDPGSTPAANLDARLEVEVVEQRADGWNRVVCANGWTCWIDGRRLRPVPWKRTHLVPAAGLPAWERPDPQAPSVASLAGGLGVAVREQRADSWARVVCENGWSCWVDGRQLTVAPAATATRAGTARSTSTSGTTVGPWQPGAGPFALGGAALAFLGSFLPWLTGGGTSISAWKIPVAVLIDETNTGRNPKVGLLLLLVALVGIPYLTRRPAPRYLSVVLGAVATNLAGLTVVFKLKFDPGPGIGFGLVLTFLGGAAMIFDRALTAKTIHS